MSEKTHWAWWRIAFKRAARGLPPLNLSSLSDDDKRRIYYLVGQIEGERSRGGAK